MVKYEMVKKMGLLVVASVALARPALAEQTRFYNLEGFGTWLDGNPETTAVTEDGEIILGSLARERFTDAGASFSAATALGDDVVVARVDDGRVVAIDRAGKSRDLYQAKDSLVTALASHQGKVYIALGPPAKIIEVDGTKSRVYSTPAADFIWDIDVGSDGALYLATGQPGAVMKVTPGGKAVETLFEPEQTHLRSITVDSSLGVFVGGGERGILYRSPSGKAKEFRALFDSGHPEITAIVIKDGHAFVSGVTGAQALAAEEGNEQHGGKGKGPDVRSQLAKVAMDGTAEVLAGSNDEAIFDVAVDDRGFIVVATGATGRDDPRGRLYTVEPKERLIAMVYQSPSRRITHLVNLPRGALGAVAAGGGRIVHLAGGVANKGEFITMPFDTVINSKFGIIQIFANQPKGTKVTASVRTGQTATPDETWTDWSPEIAAPGNQAPRVQNGRYLQLRLTLHGAGNTTPRVNRVRMAYMRQNLRPFVREVVALKKGLALLPVYHEESKSKSVSLNEKASVSDKRPENTSKRSDSSRARQVPEDGALTVKWVAEDPNGDDLKYDLMVKGAGQDDWRTIQHDLDQPFYTLQSSQLPDGHYLFRVKAHDSPSNAPGFEQSDTRESQAVLVDNTPPHVDPIKVEVNGRRAVLRLVVADAVGPLVDAAFSLNGEPFRLMAPDDGVLDGPGESFTLRLSDLSPGRHTVTVKVADEGENVGFGEATFEIR